MKGTKRKLAVFDLDGTIFRNSLLIELHWELVKEGVFSRSVLHTLDRYYHNWVNRRGEYEDYLSQVIKLFDRQVVGIPAAVVRHAARRVVRQQKNIVYRFTRDLLQKIKKDHILIAISGSPVEAVREFTRYWKFDYVLGTEMEIKKGYYTGQKSVVHSLDKKGSLRTLLQAHGLVKQPLALAVGDTEADVGILELAAKPICFNPNQKLYQIAKKQHWEVVVERKNVIYEMTE